MDEDIAICLIEEADQRLVQHAYNCFRNNIFSVVISTNDTDIVMLLIANFPYMYDINRDSKRTYIINELAVQIGFEKCKGFSFFHAFTGCDTVSSFFKHSKTTLLNCWLTSENQEFTKTFQELSDTPVEVNENHLNLLEEFVKDGYYPKRKANRSLDDLQMENFLALADMNLRLLPPSKKGLYKHAQRGCLQGGWINRECRDNVLAQDPRHWGWKKTNHVFLPEWQDSIDIV